MLELFNISFQDCRNQLIEARLKRIGALLTAFHVTANNQMFPISID